MFPVKEFAARFGEILEALDAVRDDCAADAAEDMDDLNAELEDAILMLNEFKADDEDLVEELGDQMDHLKFLAGDYRKLAGEIPALAELTDRLETAADMAMNELGYTPEAE